jgi:SAM-dependent methyltransferase
MSRMERASRHVGRNIQAYGRRAASYDEIHTEIFNSREQARLRQAVEKASMTVRSGGRQALDFGAGTGNVSRHMIGLGYDVTAADVSPAFLRLLQERLNARTIELTDGSPNCIPDNAFDLIGVYSVMHHIPDYLGAATALVKKLKPGGVLLIDHERNDNYWVAPPTLAEFRRENARARTGKFWDPEHRRWQYLFRAAVTPSRHLARLRKRRRISTEGDVHVYSDDHIEWDRLIGALGGAGAELVERIDYLHFAPGYDEIIWERYKHRCNDVTAVIARRIA